MMSKIERCSICDESTGNAGIGDDSIVCECCGRVICENCKFSIPIGYNDEYNGNKYDILCKECLKETFEILNKINGGKHE